MTDTFRFRSMNDEVIRLDSDGFHYRGQFIADAGEAHRLMMDFLKQNTHPQPEPEGHQAIAKRAIESCLAQRDEVLAAFIAKYGFQPEDVIQVEQRQPDGTSTWRIERRPGPKPEELRDEDLEATARAAEIQPEPGEVEELVRRLRDWQSIPLLEERERAATLLQQLSTITTEDLNND